MNFIDFLNSPLNLWKIEYRIHATRRMFERDIDEVDILYLLENGAVIEKYSSDFPFPSVLVNGTDENGRALHAVDALDAKLQRLYLITVYKPDQKKWRDHFSRRIKR